MDAATMTQLERDAANIGKPATTYLADALAVLRDPSVPYEDRPLVALRVLAAMQNTNYAKRRDQQGALAAAGGWLDARLRREAHVDADQLAGELAWLKRLVQRFGDSPPAKGSPFGGGLDALARKREAPAAQQGPPIQRSALDRARGRMEHLNSGNAAAEVPKILEIVSGDDERAVARELVDALGLPWLRQRNWAVGLLETAGIADEEAGGLQEGAEPVPRAQPADPVDAARGDLTKLRDLAHLAINNGDSSGDQLRRLHDAYRAALKANKKKHKKDDDKRLAALARLVAAQG
jgi:hypothetical protein